MSAIRWVAPAELLDRVILPSGPTGAMTRLGTVWPSAKFRLDAVGRLLPEAYTLR